MKTDGTKFSCNDILNWGFDPRIRVNFMIVQPVQNNLDNDLVCYIRPEPSGSEWKSKLTVSKLIDESLSLFEKKYIGFYIDSANVKQSDCSGSYFVSS